MSQSSKYAGEAIAATVAQKILESFGKPTEEERLAELEKKEFVLLDAPTINRYPQNKTPDDMHIFPVGKERTIKDSVCGWYTIPSEHSLDYVSKIQKAPEIREEVAGIGRKVCGTCVSTLYSDKDKSKK